jgi:hypothetical protein
MYLIFKYLSLYVFNRGEIRREARSILKMAVSAHANRC